MEQKTAIQPNFRLNRALRTLQGLDYILCLRNMRGVNFWDYDHWVNYGSKRAVRDFTFVKDVNNNVQRPKTAEDREKSKLRKLMPIDPNFPSGSKEEIDGWWQILEECDTYEEFCSEDNAESAGCDDPVPLGRDSIVLDSSDDESSQETADSQDSDSSSDSDSDSSTSGDDADDGGDGAAVNADHNVDDDIEMGFGDLDLGHTTSEDEDEASDDSEDDGSGDDDGGEEDNGDDRPLNNVSRMNTQHRGTSTRAGSHAAESIDLTGGDSGDEDMSDAATVVAPSEVIDLTNDDGIVPNRSSAADNGQFRHPSTLSNMSHSNNHNSNFFNSEGSLFVPDGMPLRRHTSSHRGASTISRDSSNRELSYPHVPPFRPSYLSSTPARGQSLREESSLFCSPIGDTADAPSTRSSVEGSARDSAVDPEDDLDQIG